MTLRQFATSSVPERGYSLHNSTSLRTQAGCPLLPSVSSHTPSDRSFSCACRLEALNERYKTTVFLAATWAVVATSIRGRTVSARATDPSTCDLAHPKSPGLTATMDQRFAV